MIVAVTVLAPCLSLSRCRCFRNDALLHCVPWRLGLASWLLATRTRLRELCGRRWPAGDARPGRPSRVAAHNLRASQKETSARVSSRAAMSAGEYSSLAGDPPGKPAGYGGGYQYSGRSVVPPTYTNTDMLPLPQQQQRASRWSICRPARQTVCLVATVLVVTATLLAIVRKRDGKGGFEDETVGNVARPLAPTIHSPDRVPQL